MSTAVNTLINIATGQPVELAMQRLELTGRAYPVGALLRLVHRFRAKGTDPIEAVYVSQLPRNGTLRRFVIKGEDFEVESVLKEREEAQQVYDDGIAGGHLSSLAETHADGMVSLTVGQVRPDEDVTVILEVVVGIETKDKSWRLRYPFTLAPNYHSQAKSYPTAEGMAQELPSGLFGDLVLPEWKTEEAGLHQVSFKIHLEPGAPLDAVSSPSHRVLVRPNPDGSAEVELAASGDVPNRDLVIDVTTREDISAVFADASLTGQKKEKGTSKLPDGAPAWTAVIPSSQVPKAKHSPRRVCFVLDRSGSMQGQPIDRAKRALQACLSGLAPTDEFGLVAFDNKMEVFHESMTKATKSNRERAATWIDGIDARGGTELAKGLGTGVRVLGGPGGDIFLLTDGQVYRTGEIVEQVAASGTRVHTLGIGTASQDRFLAALARRSEGVSRMVGPTEDVAGASMALFNAVRQPVQVGASAFVDMKGSKITQAHEVGTVWDGYPVLVTDQASGKGLPMQVNLGWDTKSKKAADNIRVTVPAVFVRPVPDGMVALLWAGRKIEDLESQHDMAQAGGPLQTTINMELKGVSSSYGLASRAMSLVAVVKRAGDQAGVEPAQQIVPVGLPEGRGVTLTRAIDPNVLRSRLAMASGPDSSWNSPAQVLYSAAAPMQFDSAPIRSAGGGRYGSSAGGGESQTKGLVRTSARRSPKRRRGTISGFSSDSLRIVPTEAVTTVTSSVQSFETLSLCDATGPGAGTVPTSDVGLVSEGTSTLDFMEAEPVRNVGFDLETVPSNTLLAILSALEDDGGVPGPDLESRFVRTALLAIEVRNVDASNLVWLYRVHLTRMTDFLEANVNVVKFKGLGVKVLKGFISALRGQPQRVPGDWAKSYDLLVQDPTNTGLRGSSMKKMTQAV